jgi:predicted SprT family Zn-dependent metalloprotease
MDLHAAQPLAVALMRQYGLDEKEWEFHFNNNARRAGVCKVFRPRQSALVSAAQTVMRRMQLLKTAKPNRIELSRPWTRLHSEAQVRDTILHEIAHALAGPSARHGPRWKKVAQRLGAEPKSCFHDERLAKEPLYTIFCPNSCGKPIHRYKLSREWRLRLCSECTSPFVIFDHRRKTHFRYVPYSSVESRRLLTIRESIPKLGKRPIVGPWSFETEPRPTSSWNSIASCDRM